MRASRLLLRNHRWLVSEPRQCQGCPTVTAKGYSKNPVTGRESKFDFYCDECYERGMVREAQSQEYQRRRTSSTYKAARKKNKKAEY